MIKQLIKYLWKTYGPKQKARIYVEVSDTPNTAEIIIKLADRLEKDGLCQTIAVPKNSWAEVSRNDQKGGIAITEYGPSRIIIIKGNSNAD